MSPKRRRNPFYAHLPGDPVFDEPAAPFVVKEECPGCRSLVDDLGRYAIGFCGPDCLVRKARNERQGGIRLHGR